MHHLILALGLALATVAFCHSARAACQCNCMWNEFSFNEMHQRNNSSLPLGQLSTRERLHFFQITLVEFMWLSFFQRKSCNLCHCMILYHPIVLVARHGWILWSADVLSGRHIVRVTFCHGFLIDVLSGRHFVSTYFVRHFVRKTFCQFSFFVVGFCIDVLSGRQIVSILTIFLVCWHYLWYVYVISGILTIFLVCLPCVWYFDHISGMLTLFLVCSPLYLVCWRYFWYVYLMSGILTIFPAYILKARIAG